MVRAATARRNDAGQGFSARHRPLPRDRQEPVLAPTLAPAPAAKPEPPVNPVAVIAMAVRAARAEAVEAAAPPVVIAPEAEAAVPVPPVAVDRAGDAEVSSVSPVVLPTWAGRSEAAPPDRPTTRVTASFIASVLIHLGALALFLYLGLQSPTPMIPGEEGVPVELVADAQAGASAQQETASGNQDKPADDQAQEERQHVEAPPAETPVEPPMAETSPVPTPVGEPPAAQPDPVTTAERILDQLPTPVLPETLPIAVTPPEPAPAAVQPQPVQETPPPPAVEPVPRVETEAPSEVQAVVTPPPTVTPPQQQAVVAPTRPATRPPPTRRQAPTDARTTRPTRQAAAAPAPERPARAARQTETRASAAERGEGTGQRNRQPNSGTATAGAASAAALGNYRGRVIAHLARFKVYPESARDRGITGSVGFTLTVTRAGGVASVSITSSSGAPILDQATLAMVRRAQPLPPMPEGGPSSMSISTRMGYALR
jgi:protein TonB